MGGRDGGGSQGAQTPREQEWLVPLDEPQWSALVRIRPHMVLEFLLASGPNCLKPTLSFRDSMGRHPPMARIDRLGGALQVYMTNIGHLAPPTFHERGVRGCDRFTARYGFGFGRVEYAPGDFGSERLDVVLTEKGRFLRLRESLDPRTIREIADAVGFPVPPGLARRMERRAPLEIPWASLRAPWPRFTQWLGCRRSRVERAVFRPRSLPRGAIASLVDAGAEVELGRRGAEVTASWKARLDRVMGAVGPCPASIAVEMRPGDARRGFTHAGRLKGTDLEVAYNPYMLHGEWKGGKLTLWVGEEEAEWGALARGLEMSPAPVDGRVRAALDKERPRFSKGT